MGNTNALIYAEWNTDICLSIEIKFIYLFGEKIKEKTLKKKSSMPCKCWHIKWLHNSQTYQWDEKNENTFN